MELDAESDDEVIGVPTSEIGGNLATASRGRPSRMATQMKMATVGIIEIESVRAGANLNNRLMVAKRAAMGTWHIAEIAFEPEAMAMIPIVTSETVVAMA